MKNLFYLFAIALFLVSCGGTEQKSTNETAETATTAEASTTMTTPSGLTITPFENTYEFADAQLAGYNYQNKTFRFNVNSETYKLGQQTPDAEQKLCANSGKGQHLHLIIDNEPYLAKYEASFEHEVADGEHYFLSFLSRSYHESIKSYGASSATKVNIKDFSITKVEPITEPMVFYSRPKGTYVGEDTKKVMLDFFLVNTELGEYGNKVKATINGEDVLFDKWQPYYIEGLPMGENNITLTLVDPNGNVVATPLNPVTRTFNLMAEKPTAN